MTIYQVRRGSAVLTTKPDEASARLYAQAFAHHPGQLAVWKVVHEETPLGEASAEPDHGKVRSIRKVG